MTRGTTAHLFSVVIDGDPGAYVEKLQPQGEGDIAVLSGVETVRSLFLAGVIDAPDTQH